MKKIKLFLGVALVTTLLGITSIAAVTTTSKGVQKLDSADTVDVINNNADVLDAHIDKTSSTDVLGHIKIGTGLEVGENGTTSVKIANDLNTNDSEMALSAAQGMELKNILGGTELWTNPNESAIFSTGTVSLSESISNYETYEVLYRFSGTISTTFNTGRIPVDRSTLLRLNYIYYIARDVSVSGDSATFGNANIQTTYGDTTITVGNSYLIPYKIIGYKY